MKHLVEEDLDNIFMRLKEDIDLLFDSVFLNLKQDKNFKLDDQKEGLNKALSSFMESFGVRFGLSIDNQLVEFFYKESQSEGEK